MRLFALLGRNGIGKSIAIRAVRDELVLHGGKILWEYPNNIKNATFHRGDIITIIEYNNKIVALCSKGDKQNLIQDMFYKLFDNLDNKNLKKRKLDYLICAVRNNDANTFYIMQAIMNYIKYHRINMRNNEIKIFSLNTTIYNSVNKKIKKVFINKVFKEIK